MLHKEKTIVFFFALAFSTAFLNCGQELPLKELALAKTQIERAENLQAKQYAPDEFAEAEKSLKEANEAAAAENASESKKSADYAISRAYDALEKTLPKLVAKTREEAVGNIDAADEANASDFAPEELKKANLAKEAGDSKLASADSALASYLREDKEDQKEIKRNQALDEYEQAYVLFKEAKQSGNDAKVVSLEKSDTIRQSAEDVESTLEKASKYSNGTNPSVEEEKARIQSAYEDIDAGKLKSAEEKIKTARAASGPLLAAVVKDHAKERNSQARDVVEDANARFAELNSDSLLKSPSTKDDYSSAQENLAAANESLGSSSALFEQEKYEDSIGQSEEAIRLSEISLDQIGTLANKNTNKETVANKKEKTATVKEETVATTDAEEGDENSAGSSLEDLGKGWKRYTVGKSNPADCLWRIAKKKDVYNDSKLWPRIFEANRGKIKNKNLIYPKQKLNIPPKTGKIGKAPKK
ncbi:lipoprotein LipL71 [Leptospira idonii]|uniref:Lipoprotein LipL71 n=1 Tax=Leptospira idonii TaxID=1193500 RepID=A0A4R9LX05_9LEPT|nr:lipoprotein LipL71 [Leptospira idonii]TGN17637.1 lipoprotein LipL71 [Leptospira idonii]